MGVCRPFDKADKVVSRGFHRLNIWYFEFVVYPFAMLFNPLTIWLYPVLAFFYQNRFTFSARSILAPLFLALYMLIWVLAAYLALTLLKNVFERDRPVELNAGRRCSLKRKGWGRYSLPSGDVAQAMLIVCFFVWFYGFPAYWYALVALVAFARLFYQASWIFDLVLGAAIGFGLFWCALALHTVTLDFWNTLVH